MIGPNPPPTPEGEAIRQATKLTGRSIRSLAAEAGMSDGRWRQIMHGWQSGRGGARVPDRGPPRTLARMARVLGWSPDDLRALGRDDAAEALEKGTPDKIAQPAYAYLVAHPDTISVFLLDEAKARRNAKLIGGVVIRSPIIADYRRPDG